MSSGIISAMACRRRPPPRWPTRRGNCSGAGVAERAVMVRSVATVASIRSSARMRAPPPARVRISRARPCRIRKPSLPSGHSTSMLLVRRTAPARRSGAGFAVTLGKVLGRRPVPVIAVILLVAAHLANVAQGGKAKSHGHREMIGGHRMKGARFTNPPCGGHPARRASIMGVALMIRF